MTEFCEKINITARRIRCLYYSPIAYGRYIVKNKIICFVLCSIIISLMLVPIRVAAASNTCTLMQAYIDEKVLDIIARGDFDLQNADVKVANRQSKITDSGSVSEGKIHIRTTVLLDVSASMPYATRAKVIEFIEAKIKELAGYEELRLVTFGDKVDVIQDFSSDRYDLSNAAKGIEFNGQASAIYDAINSTITHSGSSDGSPYFYRTIVITDGVDYTAGGITKEELFMRLRTETYPIDVIEVSKDKLTSPDKDLAALSRISNGSYSELYSGSAVSKCVSNVSPSNLFWIRAEVSANLLDGSTRQVDISDGNNSFSFDMKMSVVDAPVESSAPSSTTVTSSTKPPVPVESKPTTEIPDDDETEGIGPMIINLITIIGGVLLIAAVVVIVPFAVKRKKKSDNESRPFELPAPSDKNNGETVVIFDEESQNSYTIRLTSCADPSKNWTVTVKKDVYIGRAETCDIKFGDSSVSREQFKLIAGDMGVMLSNLSTSNVTKVNNNKVTADVMLQLGDIVKFGRISLSVDLIQKISGDDPPSDDHSFGNTVGDTMTVF